MSKTDKTTTNTAAMPDPPAISSEIIKFIVAVAESEPVSKYIASKKICRRYEIATYIGVIIVLLVFVGAMIANKMLYPVSFI